MNFIFASGHAIINAGFAELVKVLLLNDANLLVAQSHILGLGLDHGINGLAVCLIDLENEVGGCGSVVKARNLNGFLRIISSGSVLS